MGVERALLSVFDKTGIVEFARRLAAMKIEILSTGGTAKLLRDEGVTVKDVSELTGWPEMLGGRVKTLHPKVHGGLLYRRNHADDQKQAKEHGIAAIDLVVVNLYPFEATAAKGYLTAEELIENIDIGGPTMLRSAAKNFESVTVVTDPADYSRVAQELETKGETTLPLRVELARKVFATTSRYDGLIATELERLAVTGQGMEVNARAILPERVHLSLRKQQELRYGENPHQAAALYVPAGRAPEGLAAAKQLQGKELSYNNYVDLEAARSLVSEFERPAAVIIKHNNPCGAAQQSSLLDAYLKAYACDPISAFGGVLAFNHIVDAVTAEAVSRLFVECIVAPGFADEARDIFAAKKNLRLLVLPQGGLDHDKELQLKRILGGVLVQQPDLGTSKRERIARGDEARAERNGTGGPAVRVESVQAREIECHRVCQGWSHGRRGRGTNEPRGFSEARGDEGAEFAAGNRGGFRRVLSISRRCGRSRKGGSHGCDSTGRVSEGSRGDRRGGSIGHGDGFHEHAALPALESASAFEWDFAPVPPGTSDVCGCTCDTPRA